GPARAAGRQLGGDEHVSPVQAAVGEGAADLLLVAVHGGGVDVPVAGLERVPGGLVREFAVQLPGAEPDHRHRDTAAKVYRRDVGHRSIVASRAGKGEWTMTQGSAEGGADGSGQFGGDVGDQLVDAVPDDVAAADHNRADVGAGGGE